MVKLNDLFDISYGTKFDWNKMTEEQNGIAFVSRTSKNNGVVGYVERYNDLVNFHDGCNTERLIKLLERDGLINKTDNILEEYNYDTNKWRSYDKATH